RNGREDHHHRGARVDALQPAGLTGELLREDRLLDRARHAGDGVLEPADVTAARAGPTHAYARTSAFAPAGSAGRRSSKRPSAQITIPTTSMPSRPASS